MAITLFIALALITVCALLPLGMFLVNLRRYRTPRTGREHQESVSILIPARDEEDNIRACVESVLATQDVDCTVWVCDDHSTDRTATIVQELAAADPRVHLVPCPELPAGWNGKQHACWKLARSAAHDPVLLFLDADVRVDRWTVARCIRTLRDDDLALLSGFPRQIFSGWLDRLLLPLIHFILLGYLPLSRMEKSTDPRFSAGCGQFLLVDRSAYFASGGHAAIHESRHDGLRLPRLFREHGFRTGLADLTRLATVRMYPNARATWNGLAKNATEGMAATGRIVPFTLLLFLGSIAPVVFALAWIATLSIAETGAGFSGTSVWDGFSVAMTGLAIVAVTVAYLPRLIAVHRFRQPVWSALLHPLGVAVLIALQWRAWLGERLGKPVAWRARSYSTESGSEVTPVHPYRFR
jgi:hypothetical protein